MDGWAYLFNSPLLGGVVIVVVGCCEGQSIHQAQMLWIIDLQFVEWAALCVQNVVGNSDSLCLGCRCTGVLVRVFTWCIS